MKQYLALGDSYTIGEAVMASESYPFQLTELLRNVGLEINAPRIIATTGWTTDELASGIEKAQVTGNFDMVTLLIGVNNQYRGRSTEAYRRDFRRLLRKAKKFAGGNKTHVIVISIPDWGVTPFALEKGNSDSIAAKISEFNKVNREEAEKFGVYYVDIMPTSYLALDNLEYVANDKLHFSGKMYAEWATLVLPTAQKVLG